MKVPWYMNVWHGKKVMQQPVSSLFHLSIPARTDALHVEVLITGLASEKVTQYAETTDEPNKRPGAIMQGLVTATCDSNSGIFSAESFISV